MKNVRKILIASLIVGFMSTSCSEKSLNEVIEDIPEIQAEIGEQRAIETLTNFLQSLNDDPQTRASISQSVITGVKKTPTSEYRGNVTTRTDEQGLAVYEMTLKNPDATEGFAIVTDDEEFSEVIAYTPYGSISDTLYNEGLAIYFRELAAMSEYVSQAITTKADYWQPGWEDVLFDPYYYQENYDQSTREFVRYLTAWEIETYCKKYSWIFYDPIDKTTIYSAYVPTEWDQSTPYNNQVKTFVQGTTRRARVGCLPVAVGQIMAFHKYPASYNWSVLTQTPKITASHAGANEVARLLTNIATASKTVYSDKAPNGTGTTYISDYIPALNSLGYTVTQTSLGTAGGSSKLIKEEIDKNKRPVLYAAQTTSVIPYSGHAWVIDAVRVMERWKYISSFSSNGTCPLYRYRAVGTLIHCNWGWGGSSNGWFYNFKVPHYDGTTGILHFDHGKYLYTNIKPK